MSFSEWKEVKLKDISKDRKGKYGIAASAVEYSEDLLTYLRITDITDDGVLNKEGLKSVNDDNANNYILEPNDIVFARTGNSTGRSYFYDGSVGELVYAGFLIKFSLDPDKVNPKFMRYYTLFEKYKDWVQSFKTGSTRGNINARTYGDMKILLPPRKQQDFLVHILSTLDEKIEVNNRINKTLEEMAQTIFKHWFVDFEFPNEDGEPFKSSGGEMIDSELGPIPKGWEVGFLSEFVERTIGGDWGKDKLVGNNTSMVRCIRGADIESISRGERSNAPIRYILERNLNNKQLSCGDLVVEISGGSPTQSTGRITHISESILNRYEEPMICTNFCRALQLNDKSNMYFFYHYWKFLYSKDTFFNFENGTTGIKNLDINSFLDRYSIIRPNKDLIDNFTNLMKQFDYTIQNNGEINESLTKLRDTLLPKLMSGEIRVPIDIKKQ